MNKENTGMARDTGVFTGRCLLAHRPRIAEYGVTVGGFGRALIAAVLILFFVGQPSLAGAASYGEPKAVFVTAAPVSGTQDPEGVKENQPLSNADITKPSGSTDALMDAYNRRIQSVMEQVDPFSTLSPEEALSPSETLMNNTEYKKALELYLQLVGETDGAEASPGAAGPAGQGVEQANEAVETYEALYSELLARAKAHENMGQLPDVREMIEQAMASMAEDGTGVDAAVTNLYREIMERVSGQAEVSTSKEEAP